MKRVIIACDHKGWAFHRIAIQIAKRLRPAYDVTIVSHYPLTKDRDFDLLIAVWWGTAQWDVIPDATRYLLVYDHYTWPRPKYQEAFEQRMKNADRVFASSNLLIEELEQRFDREILSCKDGVDPQYFGFSEPSFNNPPVCAFVGNSKLGTTEDLPDYKGRALIEEACRLAGWDFRAADPALCEGLPFATMPGFYSQIDALMCASISEGTPNPVLEALASGLPVISTAVGLCPEIVLNTPAIQIVERDVESLRRGLDLIRDKSTRGNLGSVGRLEIMRRWTWDKRTKPILRCVEEDLEVKMIPKKRLAVIYDAVDWALHRIAMQIKEHLSDEFLITTCAYTDQIIGFRPKTTVLCLTYMAVPPMLRCVNKDASWIVCLFDEHCWKTDPIARAAFEAARQIADVFLFSSKGMMKRLRQQARGPRISGTCQDGVDQNLFPVQDFNLEQSRSLVAGWCGNQNPDYFGDLKGLEIIREAVEIARDQGHEIDLKVQDISSQPKIPHDQMSEWYRDVDVYVCASKSEGTPNPVLEAGATGRLIVSTPVGIVPELKNVESFVPRKAEAIADILGTIDDKRLEDPSYLPQRGQELAVEIHQQWRWEDRVESYRQAVRYTSAGMDTRVILISCGEETTDRVRANLQACRGYNKTWDIEEVENVAPMDMAFNKMVALADRRFHVQVDADMLLKEDAIERLRWRMHRSAPTIWQCCYPLWDTLFRRPIYGIKIYRSRVAKKYQYETGRQCEMGVIRRTRRDGYDLWTSGVDKGKDHVDVLGDHLVEDERTAWWNCYDRGIRYQMQAQRGPHNYMMWVLRYERIFARWYRETEDERYLAGRDGLITGLAKFDEYKLMEKDLRYVPSEWSTRQTAREHQRTGPIMEVDP